MRFLIMVKMREDLGTPPPALVDAMAREMTDLFKSGVMVDAGGLHPTSASAEVRVRDGELSVIDGPFTEAKELVGGYSIVEVRGRDEAIELGRQVIRLHKTHWPEWDGAAEVRQIAGPDEGPPSA